MKSGELVIKSTRELVSWKDPVGYIPLVGEDRVVRVRQRERERDLGCGVLYKIDKKGKNINIEGRGCHFLTGENNTHKVDFP